MGRYQQYPQRQVHIVVQAYCPFLCLIFGDSQQMPHVTHRHLGVQYARWFLDGSEVGEAIVTVV